MVRARAREQRQLCADHSASCFCAQHPRFGGYRDASPFWEGTDANHTAPELRWLPRRLTGAGQQPVAIKRQQPQMVYSHRYLGANQTDSTSQLRLESRVCFLSVKLKGGS